MIHLKSVTLHHDLYPTLDHYPFNLEIYQKTDSLTFEKPVTCFAGENGTGKSTLLEAITRRCGIHIWGEINRERYRPNPYEAMLVNAISADWADGPVPGSFFASQTFRNFTKLLDEWAASDPGQLGYFGGKSLVAQSHGQSLMSYFKSRYTKRGLYFLDEPETALSPKTQIELVDLITEQSRAGHAQFVIATHSPILLSIEDADIYNFNDVPISRINYTDTEHYQVYRDFFTNMK